MTPQLLPGRSAAPLLLPELPPRPLPRRRHRRALVIRTLLAPALVALSACSGLQPVPEAPYPSRQTVGSSPVTGRGPNPAPDMPADEAWLPGWGTPVFRDEFDGGLSQWTVRDHGTHGSLSYDRAVISRRQATVADGLLSITGERLPQPAGEASDRHFVTGYLDSADTFSQEYGRWEMRAKLPLPPGRSQGIWPAFWLRPDGRATEGEIDIMEAYGTDEAAPFGLSTADKSQASLHFDQSGGNKAMGWTPPLTGLHTEFHVWAVEWTPSGVAWFVNGQPYKTVAREDHPGYAAAFGTGAPFHMRLNLQYGSTDWGYPDPADPDVTVDKAVFQVDYVRVWKYDGG
ncbi:glycoside hydrolase family 16 protein [Arthrobacter gengyunqii]|uniref:Glycoside hydrolase family 16 protein n=1 Tax=Arthrobacter gengyunqii TaxID=2886940 RepID=A0A9X1M2D8_9MICC|nr:glycoside hydrolase family 16 protein [Arthrobacter gengyunqii]MCC3269645.1 glycoside hydrolase family 16 protein [Arthrobacter gengyunqii]UOY97105.1 glycoside hydrolase family 16 protein [Arthrobacter gengyunqii]